MSEPIPRGTVLKTGKAGEKAESIRRRIDRQNLLTALAVALLFHLLIILGFFLADILGLREITDWSGPVLVKIGAPDAPESKLPDPGELPDQSETEQSETPPVPDTPAEPVNETPPSEPAPPVPESAADASADATRPETPSETVESESSEVVESPFAEPAPATPPAPSRVRGDEDGNNYLLDFEGSDDEVGRNYALDYVTSYMPLPQVLPPSIFEGNEEVPKDSYRMEDLLEYWDVDPQDGMYIPTVSFIPYERRPHLWSSLAKLGYDLEQAEWKQFAKGEVIVEFRVLPSSDGAFLENITLKQGTQPRNPEVDEAIKYGLSQWSYYNTTDQPIRGTLTYRFDR